MQFAEGLNPAQWEALRYISRANAASRTPSALASYLGTTKGTVSQTLIALEAKGLVKRVRAPCDRRKVHLEATPAGDARLACDPIQRLADAAAQGLTESAADDLVNGLTRLLKQLQRQDGLKTFGVCQSCGLFVSEYGDEAIPPTGQCGLNGKAIEGCDTGKLCVDHRPDAAASSPSGDSQSR